ncbi:RNA polymerase sigma factor [Gluconobacter roseus]|uniref:RNA polymerase sigma factor n=1 Tax=Gluconobacter roseus TaxID=586239 RepID=UPI0007861BDC|nr:sigma-70 family RNA polymerase sigma factor [Gluconobacter roseus]KXV44542.1 transcriptional regulator [Gluconobacter roseus]GBR43974.1 iron-regulated sigma factor/transcriptional regulator [Gluconobacter roseus NBRC 3990]
MRCQQEWLRLYRRVRSRTRREDADDHLQNALVNYFERPEGSVQHQDAYITRSAINSSLNAIRREQQGCVQAAEGFETLLETPDPAPSQEEIYESSQKLAHFRAGCEQLPDRTRQIFLMNRVEKMKYSHIAKSLAISESSVEKHIAKALVFLSTWMDH